MQINSKSIPFLTYSICCRKRLCPEEGDMRNHLLIYFYETLFVTHFINYSLEKVV